jgi:hypothetical protein
LPNRNRFFNYATSLANIEKGLDRIDKFCRALVKVRRRLLGGDGADFNLLEAGGFEPVNLPPRLPFIPFPWRLFISQNE